MNGEIEVNDSVGKNAHACAFTTVIVPGSISLANGLTKREYFAGLAMQNLQNVLLRKSGEQILKALKEELEVDDERAIAYLAVRQADALLDALHSHEPLHYSQGKAEDQ